MKRTQGKVAVVTGSSSGIGFETSLTLARNGFYTYATMRNPEKSNLITKTATSENLPLQALSLDVNIEKSVTDGIDRVLNESERIDVLVNNAGFDLTGPLEETSMDEIKGQFETNLFGAIRTMQAVIPLCSLCLEPFKCGVKGNILFYMNLQDSGIYILFNLLHVLLLT
jgi:NAD(P)-dependent dehydrogenase (short-subunit alcohol dehydrogenase family)